MGSRHGWNIDSGQIVPDSPEALGLGFTSAEFEGYLWRTSGTIYIWRIFSKQPGKGHFSGMVQRMLESGYTVKVPTPIGRMAEIVRRKGFTPTVEYDPELEPYEIWVKEPGPVSAPNFYSPPIADESISTAGRSSEVVPLELNSIC